MKTLLKLLLLTPAALLAATPVPTEIVPAKISGAKPRNVVFILSDDHRYDAMSFMDHQFAKTPVMDSLAANGAHIKNALVTTALCSPSRASILTGLYTFRHRVIDNNRAIPKGTKPYSDHIVPRFIPQRPYDYLYWEFHEKEGRVAIRKGNWKGVRYGVATDPNSPLSCMTFPRIQVRRTTSPHKTSMSSASWMPCSKERAPFHPSPNSTSPKSHGHPIRTSDRALTCRIQQSSAFFPASGPATRSFNGLHLQS